MGKPKYFGEKVLKSDKCMGVLQLLGARTRAVPPKSTPMYIILMSERNERRKQDRAQYKQLDYSVISGIYIAPLKKNY